MQTPSVSETLGVFRSVSSARCLPLGVFRSVTSARCLPLGVYFIDTPLFDMSLSLPLQSSCFQNSMLYTVAVNNFSLIVAVTFHEFELPADHPHVLLLL